MLQKFINQCSKGKKMNPNTLFVQPPFMGRMVAKSSNNRLTSVEIFFNVVTTFKIAPRGRIYRGVKKWDNPPILLLVVFLLLLLSFILNKGPFTNGKGKGNHLIFNITTHNNRIFFRTGFFKDVAKECAKNPHFHKNCKEFAGQVANSTLRIYEKQ
jgi:hypothetical protein